MREEEVRNIREAIGEVAFQKGNFEKAIEVFDELVKCDEFIDFLTIPSYEKL
jgi:malate synthase